jgi:hypothetical protein
MLIGCHTPLFNTIPARIFSLFLKIDGLRNTEPSFFYRAALLFLFFRRNITKNFKKRDIRTDETAICRLKLSTRGGSELP